MGTTMRFLVAAIDPVDIVWIAAALGLMLAGAVVAWIFIKRRYGSLQEPQQGLKTPFTLEQLRQMLDQGEISEPEYHVLRNQIISKSKSNICPSD